MISSCAQIHASLYVLIEISTKDGEVIDNATSESDKSESLPYPNNNLSVCANAYVTMSEEQTCACVQYSMCLFMCSARVCVSSPLLNVSQ